MRTRGIGVKSQPCWQSVEKGKDDSVLRRSLRYDHVRQHKRHMSYDVELPKHTMHRHDRVLCSIALEQLACSMSGSMHLGVLQMQRVRMPETTSVRSGSTKKFSSRF
jgi:hypothetical protein